MRNLKYYKEPSLSFGKLQSAEDPRDGLMLFGPCEEFSKNSVKAGIVATKRGVELYKAFVRRLQSPIFSKKVQYGVSKDNEVQRPSYTGFEATFGIEWSDNPILTKNRRKEN